MNNKPFNRSFYFDTSPEILKRAAILRKAMTEAELALWERLRKNKIKGHRFRAQHPINKFIVDFYCHTALLAIEIDGGIHEKEIVAERDLGRELEITKLGIKIIRFTNAEIFKNLDGVILVISDTIENRMKLE